MENKNLKNKKVNKRRVGRPSLSLDPIKLKEEIGKYKAGLQNGVTTYKNLGIGKTSFFAILKNWR